jgi:hypothetical protein
MIKSRSTNRAWHVQRRREVYTQFLWANLAEREDLVDVNVDRRIIK